MWLLPSKWGYLVLPPLWLGRDKCLFVARVWAWLRIVTCGVWGSEELPGCYMWNSGVLIPAPQPLATI